MSLQEHITQARKQNGIHKGTDSTADAYFINLEKIASNHSCILKYRVAQQKNSKEIKLRTSHEDMYQVSTRPSKLSSLFLPPRSEFSFTIGLLGNKDARVQTIYRYLGMEYHYSDSASMHTKMNKDKIKGTEITEIFENRAHQSSKITPSSGLATYIVFVSEKSDDPDEFFEEINDILRYRSSEIEAPTIYLVYDSHRKDANDEDGMPFYRGEIETACKIKFRRSFTINLEKKDNTQIKQCLLEIRQDLITREMLKKSLDAKTTADAKKASGVQSDSSNAICRIS